MATASHSVESAVFVDMQGFIVNEHFVIKELAILRRTEKQRELVHKIFCSPMKWDLLTFAEKKQASWLTENHHGLAWADGDIDYGRAKAIIHRHLCESNNVPGYRIYIKGKEKAHWLRDILSKTSDVCCCPKDSIVKDYNDSHDVGPLRECELSTRVAQCGQHAEACESKTYLCAMSDVLIMENLFTVRDRALDLL